MDGSGSLCFEDFLRLMELLRDLQDQAMLEKEQAARKDTGYTPAEIEGFRELFLTLDESGEGLSFAQVKELIASICPLGEKHSTELISIFRANLSRHASQSGKESKHDELDFPELLWLLQTLWETNFAGIKDKAMTNGGSVRLNRST